MWKALKATVKIAIGHPCYDLMSKTSSGDDLIERQTDGKLAYYEGRHVNKAKFGLRIRYLSWLDKP
jgi:hypothetical protein